MHTVIALMHTVIHLVLTIVSFTLGSQGPWIIPALTSQQDRAMDYPCTDLPAR